MGIKAAVSGNRTSVKQKNLSLNLVMPQILYHTAPHLPSDVWSIILGWVASTNSTLDLKTISLVSRAISYEADRHLWRNLTVGSSGGLTGLSRIILGHDRISRHLCSLCLISTPQHHMTFTSTDMVLIQGALLRCAKLSALKLWLGTSDTGFIHDLHVRSLRTFSTDLAIDARMFAFLYRHPGIQELHLGGDMASATNLGAQIYDLLVGAFT